MAMIAPLPDNEEDRLEWLRQCDILDTLPEAAFDEVTRLAADVCGVPIVAINLVDRDRQWSKSSVGQDKDQDRRAVSFCAHTILQRDLMVVPDTWHDARFADNPLVTGDPNIRFYAGAALVTSDGFGLGSLCVVDRVPRRLTSEQEAILRVLARQVTGRIELHRHITLQDRLMADRGRLLTEARQAAEWQWSFLRDVLSSVTGGKLRLCRDAAELPPPLASLSGWMPLTQSGGVSALRHRVGEVAADAGFDRCRGQDLVTAVGEAAMNVVVHGGGGRGRICGDADTLQAWAQDWGGGIEVVRLPRATLERGYTTAGSLGHGMKMMLDTADRVSLLTGPGGTTVVMEQDKEPPLPTWLS